MPTDPQTDPQSIVPYCGPPPVPAGGLPAWNTDPVLLALFAVSALALAVVFRRRPDREARRRTLFLAAGWLALLVAFVSPLCNLTSALFSARVAQHLLVVQVAAPLVVLGWPPGRGARPSWWRPPEFAWGLFGLFLWIWHLPGPYMAALASEGVLWLMHGTLFAAACAAWRSILVPATPAVRARGLLAAFGTSVHLAMLSGLLIFAAVPLFPFHLPTTAPWGLSPLGDQQLGGLIMGVVGAFGYVLLSLYGLAGWVLDPRKRTG